MLNDAGKKDRAKGVAECILKRLDIEAANAELTVEDILNALTELLDARKKGKPTPSKQVEGFGLDDLDKLFGV